MNDYQQVIEAFVDNEPVDPADLASALADPEGRAFLIDVLALRGMVGEPVAARATLVVAPGAVSGSRRRWLPLAAAALLAVGGVGGYGAGRWRADGADVPPARSVDSTVVPAALSAPVPTRVIRLEPGVDWNERAGGN